MELPDLEIEVFRGHVVSWVVSTSGEQCRIVQTH